MISRRAFLGGAAAAAGAGIWVPRLEAQDDPAPTSALATGRPKPLSYKELPGFLSARQISWHYDSHYEGALKAFLKLDAAAVGDHRPRVSNMNSVLLHELYFDNMAAGAPGEPGRAASEAVRERFGSFDRWVEDFRAAALSCRGWAVLAWHPIRRRLYNVATDSHEDGPPWLGVPLVVIDMYEHSYYLDFQNRKTEYVDGFLARVDWREIERRVRAAR
jgi:Fe-Mn family superoxide dismutase